MFEGTRPLIHDTMQENVRLRFSPRWQLPRQRLTVVALVTLLLSLSALMNPELLDFFTPAQIVRVWLLYVAELAVIAAALLATFTAMDRALPSTLPLRLSFIVGVLLAVSVALSLLLHVHYAGGFEHLPPAPRIVGDALRWGLPAVFLAAIDAVQQRAWHADMAAHAAELAHAQWEQGESEQQLALLQAQIEPHFLFNTLGNVRRLYRTQPGKGAEAIDSLLRYLESVLPQLRIRHASLGDELELVEAYLRLFALRMGPQLRYAIDCEPALRGAEFPPMLLVTLVENAIKHGIEPAGGGSVEVLVVRRGDVVEASVLDDGVGFGATASSGSGVGLVNIRRQLTARYSEHARLVLEAREPRGACATIAIPLQYEGHRKAGNDALAPA